MVRPPEISDCGARRAAPRRARSAVGEGGHGLTDGSTVHVEEGKPLAADEVLFRAYRTVPADGAAAATAGGDAAADELAERVAPQVVCECGCGGASRSPTSRRRWRHTLRSRRARRRGCGCTSAGKTVAPCCATGALRQAFTGGFDDKEVAIQELSRDEQLGDDALLLRWQQIGADGAPGAATASWRAAERRRSCSTLAAAAALRAALGVAKPPTVGARR